MCPRVIRLHTLGPIVGGSPPTKDDMLSGTHRNSLQEQVIYSEPALEASTDLAKAFGAHRLMITSTASLAGPGGIAQHMAKDYRAGCVGISQEARPIRRVRA